MSPKAHRSSGGIKNLLEIPTPPSPSPKKHPFIMVRSVCAGDSGRSVTILVSQANAVPTSTNEVAKQGAYGKVKIHSESLLSQLSHYDEVVTAIKYKMGLAGAKRPE